MSIPGDCRVCVRRLLHLPHARSGVPALPDPSLHLHKTVRAVPQQKVEYRPDTVHVGRRTEGELFESDGDSRFKDISVPRVREWVVSKKQEKTVT